MLRKVEFAAGYVKDESPLASEGGYVDGDKVRFRQGRAETIGGWTPAVGSTFAGVARGAHGWTDLSGNEIAAWGTADKLFALADGTISDITPTYFSEGVLAYPYPKSSSQTASFTAMLADDQTGFTVTSGSALTLTIGPPYGQELPAGWTIGVTFSGAGSIDVEGTILTDGRAATVTCVKAGTTGGGPGGHAAEYAVAVIGAFAHPFETANGSAVVKVNHSEHGLVAGQAITFTNAQAVGGITVNGAYTVTTVLSRDKYTITHGSNATSTANGGVRAGYRAAWTSGTLNGSSSALPSVWSLDNFGETLLAVRRGGPLYQFQPASSYPELATSTWASGTGWSFASGTGTATAGTASNLSQNIEGVVKAGYVYRLAFNLTQTAGNLYFKVNCGNPAAVISVGEASSVMSASGTYSVLFVAPSDPIDIVFSKDAAFDGTVSGVSLKLENKAFIVPEAPRHIDVMWVDPARIVCLGGTFEADGDYNPTLIRWSDQENLRQWIPSDANLAGEQPLSSGGRVVSAKATRGQTVIGTDAGIHSMQFTGDASAFAITQRGTGNAPMGRHAMTEQNGRVFWWSSNGNFYVYDGASAQAIPCRLRRDAYDNLAQYQDEKIFAWVNATFSEVWFHYPDSRDGTECSRVVVFNYEENHWVSHSFARSSAIPSGIFDYPLMFSTSGDVFSHEYGQAANGSALTSYLETAYFDVEDGGNLMVLKRIVPDFEDQTGDVSFTLTTKPFPNGSSVTTGPFTAATTTQMLNIRCMGRQIKIRLDSSANPSFWRMGLLRLEADKSGALR